MDVDKDLIDRIVAETLKALSGAPHDCKPGGTLVIADPAVPAPARADAYLDGRFPGRETVQAPAYGADAPKEENLARRALENETIVLLAPRLWLLENIALGRDAGEVEHAVLRSVLWGKNVLILLDFEIPKFKRGTFFEKINDILDALSEMGVGIASYECTPPGETIYSLVTEQEVTDAYDGGKDRILCARGAVITPAARDRARELNIKMDG